MDYYYSTELLKEDENLMVIENHYRTIMLVLYSRLGTESEGEDRPKQVNTQVSTLGTKKNSILLSYRFNRGPIHS